MYRTGASMNTGDLIQLLILIVYGLQLLVLVLGYFGIIREAGRNARERQKAIDDVADKARLMLDGNAKAVNDMAKRNAIVLGAIGVLATLLLFANRRKDKSI